MSALLPRALSYLSRRAYIGAEFPPSCGRFVPRQVPLTHLTYH